MDSRERNHLELLHSSQLESQAASRLSDLLSNQLSNRPLSQPVDQHFNRRHNPLCNHRADLVDNLSKFHQINPQSNLLIVSPVGSLAEHLVSSLRNSRYYIPLDNPQESHYLGQLNSQLSNLHASHHFNQLAHLLTTHQGNQHHSHQSIRLGSRPLNQLNVRVNNHHVLQDFHTAFRATSQRANLGTSRQLNHWKRHHQDRQSNQGHAQLRNRFFILHLGHPYSPENFQPRIPLDSQVLNHLNNRQGNLPASQHRNRLHRAPNLHSSLLEDRPYNQLLNL